MDQDQDQDQGGGQPPPVVVPQRLPRRAAQALLRDLTAETQTIKVILWSCDASFVNEEANLVHILRGQTRSLVAQRNYIATMLTDPNGLRQQHPRVFTQEITGAWAAFQTTVDNLAAIQLNEDTTADWRTERETINFLFNVDLAPHEDEDDDENEELRLQGGADIAADPDAAFDCEENLRAKLITAGTMNQDINLGQSTLMVYIHENIVKPFKPFTGEGDDESLLALFRRFDEIHRAPITQISYQRKIEAVFMCLDGKAKSTVIGFANMDSRIQYLKLWQQLFDHFGNKSRDISKQLRLIAGAAPKSKEPEETMTYLNVLKNASEQLQMHEHPADQISGVIWSSVKKFMPKIITKYCEKRPRFSEDFGSDVSIWHSQDGLRKFDQFYKYMLSHSIAEASVREQEVPILAGQSKEENKEESKPVEAGKRKLEDKDSDSEEPPSKKKKKEAGQTDNQKGNKKNLKKVEVCFLCKGNNHPWIRCYMMIDARMEAFRNEGRCTKCAKLGHSAQNCPSTRLCKNCADPQDPSKGHHHISLCWIENGYPTGHPMARGQGGGRRMQGRAMNPRGGRGRGNPQQQGVGLISSNNNSNVGYLDGSQNTNQSSGGWSGWNNWRSRGSRRPNRFNNQRFNWRGGRGGNWNNPQPAQNQNNNGDIMTMSLGALLQTLQQQNSGGQGQNNQGPNPSQAIMANTNNGGQPHEEEGPGNNA